MKSFQKELTLKTQSASDIIDITPRLHKILAESGILQGIALIFPLHTSSAVYLSDSDPSLTLDFADLLDSLVPQFRDYRHDHADYKKNAAGHLKAILSGHSVTLPITHGQFHLGTYQTIYYFEFDGQRDKEILIKIIGD